MVKGIGITIIADEIKNEEGVDAIKQHLSGVLPETAGLTSTEAYTKFHDSYKLEFSIPLKEIADKEKIVYNMLLLADSIAKPWLVFLDKDGDNTELIFNRDTNTHVTRSAFYAIRWAHIQLIY